MATVKKTILIVEDDESIGGILSNKLIKEGFDLLRAVNGEEGLKQALAEHPDLILLDIIMPKMDGITMAGKLRQDSWGKDAKIVILTNLSGSETPILKEGAYDYLVKAETPIDEIVNEIKRKLG
jgi:two-component system, OmpR family, alkaline phosphatase synthesis response regulator PhoP